MPVLCQIIPAELRATAYGIFNFTSCVCGGVMALVAGMLKDSVGLAVAIEISALCMIAGAVCLVILSVTRLGVTGVPGLALVTGTKES
jgi:hypothetical protein